jgi:hypothetical protein
MTNLPARADMVATWLLGLPQRSYADPTYPHLALLHYDEIWKSSPSLSSAEPKPTDPTGTFPSPVGILGPDTRQNSGTGAP